MPKPNILFLMTDQMQGRVLEPGHSCPTPNFDRLIRRGVRFDRAYTPNAVCSPARASLMTGLLPHSHGVLWVTHCVDKDQGNLRNEYPHWAQRLADNGYRTGYFGKWHVEHTEMPGSFGWQVDGSMHSRMFTDYVNKTRGNVTPDTDYSLVRYNDQPEGYKATVHYAVSDYPVNLQPVALVTDLAKTFIQQAGDEPWCCVASCQEPHDPFVCSQQSFDMLDVDSLPLAPNWNDDLDGRPGLYRKCARVFAGMTDRQRQEAAACYYGRIIDIDRQYGRLLDLLEKNGQIDNTIIVLSSDHGELLGAHGLYCKNISAYEEVYNIPMVLAGPGIAQGQTSRARVGLHDVGPTLLEMACAAPLGQVHGRSFADVLRHPTAQNDRFNQGFAEYFGSRYMLSQRVFWDDDWKLVLNGFDFDELYDLERDPYELNNLIDDPACKDRIREMMTHVHRIMKETGGKSIMGANYPPLRLEPYGPQIIETEA